MTGVNTDSLPIGRALKVERVAAGLSLSSVARALGISPGHLSHIEAGQRTASPERVAAIRQIIAGAGR